MVLFFTDTSNIDVWLDLLDGPSNVENGTEQKSHICEKTDGGELVSSPNLLQENDLQELTDEKHAVEVTQDLNENECTIHQL